MSHPHYPVLFAEHDCKDSCRLIHNKEDLLTIIDEFADIIDEFSCWDLLGRQIDLETAAKYLLAGHVTPVVSCASEAEECNVWPIVRAYVSGQLQQPLSPSPGEGPVQYLMRAIKALGDSD